jgi:phage/plasmid-like protein (TIGR03299 family)
MSKETIMALATNFLVGDCDLRGPSWHDKLHADLRASEGLESPSYGGAIPIEDVRRRLFNWKAVSLPVFTGWPVLDAEGNPVMDDEGNPVVEYVQDEDSQHLACSDDRKVIGRHGSGFAIHDYDETLLVKVEEILAQGLHIAGAGTPKERGQAYVQVALEGNVRSVKGDEGWPMLLAVTSLDGSMATKYVIVWVRVVCDNTMEIALGSATKSFTLKHTKHSVARLDDVRTTLDLIVQTGDAFEVEITAMMETEITRMQFEQVVENLFPITNPDLASSVTTAQTKRENIIDVWTTDNRVAPLDNSVWKAVQAFSTFQLHKGQVRKGVPRVLRNNENLIAGKTTDHVVRDECQKVLAAAS